MAETKYVQNIMNKKVVAMKPTQTVYDAVSEMSEKNIGCIIVIEKSRPVGIITERDLTNKVLLKNKDPKKTELVKVMTKKPITLTPNTTIVDAARMMKKNGFRRFPIVEKGVLLGIVTETDILYGMTEIIKHLNWKLVNTKIVLEEFTTQFEDLLS
ncbi:MAG: cyclic nucleotide-binding/CBS domain-containing protein [Candidatus Woesearchaeota archaeon]